MESEEISDEDDRIKSPVKEYYRKPAKVVEVEVGGKGTPKKKDQKRKKVHYEAIPPPITTPFPPTATTTTTMVVGIPIQVGAKSSSSAAGARRSGRAAIPSRQAKEALATKRRDGKIALRRAAEAAALLAGTSTTTTIESTAAILESIRTVEPAVEMMVLDQEMTDQVQEEVIEKGHEYGMFGKITKWFGWRQ